MRGFVDEKEEELNEKIGERMDRLTLREQKLDFAEKYKRRVIADFLAGREAGSDSGRQGEGGDDDDDDVIILTKTVQSKISALARKGGGFQLVGFNQAIGLVSPLRRQVCLNPVWLRGLRTIGAVNVQIQTMYTVLSRD